MSNEKRTTTKLGISVIFNEVVSGDMYYRKETVSTSLETRLTVQESHIEGDSYG